MRFKVGDKVKVREDLETMEEYGGWTFTDEMQHLKGKEVTISSSDKTFYTIKEYNYGLTDEMLEPLEKQEDLRELLVDGVIVKTRERGNMIYLGGVFNSTNTLSKNGECDSLGYEFNKNLEGRLAEWTIDSIYKITNMDFYSLNVIIDELPEENVELIWQRPKEEREYFDILEAKKRYDAGKKVRNTWLKNDNFYYWKGMEHFMDCLNESEIDAKWYEVE